MRTPVLLLDLDGVICDTERAAIQAWQDLYDRLGVPLDAAVRYRIIGNSAGAEVALADLGARLGRPVRPDERSWQRARKAERADAAPARPGVDWLLATAVGDGRPVGVVSSSSRVWVRRHLDRLGLRQHFAVVVTGDDTPRHKPAPDLYLAALARAGVGAAGAVAVEDSPVGVRAAHAAGVRCVAVPWEPAAGADLSLADAVLPSLRWLDLRQYERIGV
jgi:HAD superfamily hydrolase (TIGR01509 family)